MPEPILPDGFDSTLKSRTAQHMNGLVDHLYAILPLIELLNNDLQPEIRQEIIERLQTQVLVAGDHTDAIIKLIKDVDVSFELLLRQRQTSKAAFKAGWTGFFDDLRSRLTPEQRTMLKPIFVEMFMDSEASDF